MKNQEFLMSHVSVDCVIFGFDGKILNILLVKQKGHNGNLTSLKLPGSLIYNDENTDQAAERVLYELTGIKRIAMKQFKCFSSMGRTSKATDVRWLSHEYGDDITRIITIAYISLVKIDRRLNKVPKFDTAIWHSVNDIPYMPFDHNQIVKEALVQIENWFVNEPYIAFELLPTKFTASHLRMVYEAMYHKKYDVRNFHKKVAKLQYIVPLEERQQNVSHRAARYYKFDKVLYKKQMSHI